MQTNVQIDSKNLSSNDHLKRGGKYNAEVSTCLRSPRDIITLLTKMACGCNNSNTSVAINVRTTYGFVIKNE